MKCSHCGDIYERKKDGIDNCCEECRAELERGVIPQATSLQNNEAWGHLAPRQRIKNHFGG